MTRCAWATSEAMIAYHDREWGTPQHDDRVLFEFLILESAQAGLSWETILRKRDGYRAAYAEFDPARVARFDARDRARLLADPAIVRNRAKIDASIGNAVAFLEVVAEHGSFAAYLRTFAPDAPYVNAPQTPAEIPVTSPLAETFSRALRARGFRFLGPTTLYAYLQAVGIVDDHLAACFRSGRARVEKQNAPR